MGRNDNYLGNFKQRLEMSVNYTCRNIEKSGNLGAFELLICDWNSETPLRKALNLNESARKCTHFLEVSPEMYNRYVTPTSAPGYITAYNIGFRRARGAYLMVTPADVMFPYASVKALFELCRGELEFPADLSRCFLGIERYLIPWQAAERLREEDLDRFFLLHTPLLSMGDRACGVSASEGAHLFSKKLCCRVRGFAESYTLWGAQETDLARRMGQFVPLLKASIAGIYTYDLQQRPRQRDALQCNLDTVSEEICRNDENWGLGKEDIPFMPAEHHPEVCNTSPPPLPYDIADRCIRTDPEEALDGAGRAWRETLEREGAGHADIAADTLFKQSRDGGSGEGPARVRLAFETLAHLWLRSRTEPSDHWSCSDWYGSAEELAAFFEHCFHWRIHEFADRSVASGCSLLAVLATVGRQRPVRLFYAPATAIYLALGAGFVDPTLEITGYDHWRDSPLSPDVPPNMHIVAFNGYYHLETGPLETALPRLAHTQVVNKPYDCLALDITYLKGILTTLEIQLPPLLAEKSAIVLSGTTPGALGVVEPLLKKWSYTRVARLPGVCVFVRE